MAHSYTTRVREQGREGTSLQTSDNSENLLFCIKNIRKQTTTLKPFARCSSLTSCSVSVCGLEVFKHPGNWSRVRPARSGCVTTSVFDLQFCCCAFVFGHYVLDANDPFTTKCYSNYFVRGSTILLFLSKQNQKSLFILNFCCCGFVFVFLFCLFKRSVSAGLSQVHIIGHIPPGLCLSSWSWNYYHIVNRSVTFLWTHCMGRPAV